MVGEWRKFLPLDRLKELKIFFFTFLSHWKTSDFHLILELKNCFKGLWKNDCKIFLIKLCRIHHTHRKKSSKVPLRNIFLNYVGRY